MADDLTWHDLTWHDLTWHMLLRDCWNTGASWYTEFLSLVSGPTRNCIPLYKCTRLSADLTRNRFCPFNLHPIQVHEVLYIMLYLPVVLLVIGFRQGQLCVCFESGTVGIPGFALIIFFHDEDDRERKWQNV